MHIERYVKSVARDITSLGGIPFFGLLVLITLSLQQYELLFKLIVGIAITQITSISIRMIKFKDRPVKVSYSNIFEKVDASAFPSMHSAAITLYAILFSRFFNNISLAIVFGLIALGVYWSRLYLGKHYISDIIGGLVLGIVAATIVLAIPTTIFQF